ncbi:MAG TPA: spore germination protein, partial [Bacillota bacterium]
MEPQEPRPPRPLPTRPPAPVAADGRAPDPSQALPRDRLPDNPLAPALDENRRLLARVLGFQESFDGVFKDLEVAGRRALLVGLDGFLKDDILLRVAQFLVREGRELRLTSTVERLEAAGTVYIETEIARTADDLLRAVLAGHAGLLIDGLDHAVIIDQRTYPSRGPDEPALERVVRGPRDGFTETLVFNTALIRRRLRDPNLRFELLQVGRRSRTDVAVAFIKDITDPGLVRRVRSYIQAV